MNVIIGIDEAGRGPVLGPMVYSIAVVISDDVSNYMSVFEDIHIADSKTMTPEQRETAFSQLSTLSSFFHHNAILSSTFISNQQLAPDPVSLNDLAKDATIGLINKVLEQFTITHAFVDTLSKATVYQKFLTSAFPNIIFRVESKADDKFPIVGAASICAKVTRDRLLATAEFSEKLNNDILGSGYPADPITCKWLRDNMDPVFGWPDVVRFGWATATDLLDKKAVKVKWTNEPIVAGKKRKSSTKVDAKQPSIMSMFAVKKRNFFVDFKASLL
ncbi:hypothetical protein RCL1_007422 [Eukaryota sp. TZLM3-RCL]